MKQIWKVAPNFIVRKHHRRFVFFRLFRHLGVWIMSALKINRLNVSQCTIPDHQLPLNKKNISWLFSTFASMFDSFHGLQGSTIQAFRILTAVLQSQVTPVRPSSKSFVEFVAGLWKLGKLTAKAAQLAKSGLTTLNRGQNIQSIQPVNILKHSGTSIIFKSCSG